MRGRRSGKKKKNDLYRTCNFFYIMQSTGTSRLPAKSEMDAEKGTRTQQMSKSACGKQRGQKGPRSRKDAEPSEGPGVKVSEKRPGTDCCGETELEQNCRRETEVQHIWLATLLPQQSDHTSSALSLAVLSRSVSLARLGVCLLPSAPTLSFHTSSLHHFTSFCTNTHTVCTHACTHTHTRSVSLSLRPPQEDEQYSSGQRGADKGTGV